MSGWCKDVLSEFACLLSKKEGLKTHEIWRLCNFRNIKKKKNTTSDGCQIVKTVNQ